ncbi:MAG: NAD(P)H-hydrate dehydratase [Nitrospirales bacterium]|nr:NAD(P)H-hydrate dehydratase [Nitrospirales bacterium]
MKVVTSAEMREIDRLTIREYGIPGPVLMERAGLAVASKVRDLSPGKKILLLCGTGNNGGDGLVTARILHNWGFTVKALILSEAGSLGPDCEAQLRIAQRMGVPAGFIDQAKPEEIARAELIVDAVFGTGLARPVTGRISEIFEQANNTSCPVISVDIPSGISSDTGEVLGIAIKANQTITFGLPKRGHLLYPGAEYTGELSVEDIGFPRELVRSETLSVTMATQETISGNIRKRKRQTHKGDYGHVFIVAGSRGKTGAALMAARACLRAGAGLVTLGVPESLMEVFQCRVSEEMLIPLSDDGRGTISAKALDEILQFSSDKADVLAAGPGLGISEGTKTVMRGLIAAAEVPMVLDADGLNSLENPAALSQAKQPVILTPHPGEMERLIQKTEVRGQKSEDREIRQKIEKDRIGTALSFAEKTGAYVVLKGAPTITAAPSGESFINTTGNPGMATAGSGDVLTGAISGLLGQGLSPLSAAVTGVYLHGLSGDLGAHLKGERSLTATDIIEHLPSAIKAIAPESTITFARGYIRTVVRRETGKE